PPPARRTRPGVRGADGARHRPRRQPEEPLLAGGRRRRRRRARRGRRGAAVRQCPAATRPAVDRRRCLLAQQGARAPLAARAAMKDLLAIVDETPITFAILILCVTLTVLMDPFHPD